MNDITMHVAEMLAGIEYIARELPQADKETILSAVMEIRDKYYIQSGFYAIAENVRSGGKTNVF